MKKLSLLLTLLVFFFNTEAQSIFKVVEFERNILQKGDTHNTETIKYYRIVLANDSLGISPSYPLIPSGMRIDTLRAVAELLAYKGDTRICTFPVSGYNPLSSQLYLGENKDYSIQIEALFLINQLVLEKPFNYSDYPVLVDKKSRKEASISGDIVDKAFEAYCRWYRLVKTIGLEKINSTDNLPLNGTGLKWY